MTMSGMCSTSMLIEKLGANFTLLVSSFHPEYTIWPYRTNAFDSTFKVHAALDALGLSKPVSYQFPGSLSAIDFEFHDGKGPLNLGSNFALSVDLRETPPDITLMPDYEIVIHPHSTSIFASVDTMSVASHRVSVDNLTMPIDKMIINLFRQRSRDSLVSSEPLGLIVYTVVDELIEGWHIDENYIFAVRKSPQTALLSFGQPDIYTPSPPFQPNSHSYSMLIFEEERSLLLSTEFQNVLNATIHLHTGDGASVTVPVPLYHQVPQNFSLPKGPATLIFSLAGLFNITSQYLLRIERSQCSKYLTHLAVQPSERGLTPTFQPNITRYEVELPHSANHFQLTALEIHRVRRSLSKVCLLTFTQKPSYWMVTKSL